MKTHEFIIKAEAGLQVCRPSMSWWEIREQVGENSQFRRFVYSERRALYGLVAAFSQIVAFYLRKGSVVRRVDVRFYYLDDKKEDGGLTDAKGKE